MNVGFEENAFELDCKNGIIKTLSGTNLGTGEEDGESKQKEKPQ